MALDDDAVEAEKHAAVDVARVHLLAQRLERLAGEQIADARHQCAAHRLLEVVADLLGGALGGLERDVAGKTFGHHDIDGAASQIVAFDEAVVGETRQMRLAQDARGGFDLFDALDFLDADIEQPHGRALEIEHDMRHRRAHDRQHDQMLRIGADGRADIEHDGLALHRRPQAGDGGPVDLRHGAQANLGHGHQRAGVARRNRHVGLALLDRVQRQPHRGIAPPHAQRLARLGVHLDGDIGVEEARHRRQFRIGVQQRPQQFLVAGEDERQIGPPLQRDGGAGHDNGRSVVAAHGVERDPDRFGHRVKGSPAKLPCRPRCATCSRRQLELPRTLAASPSKARAARRQASAAMQHKHQFLFPFISSFCFRLAKGDCLSAAAPAASAAKTAPGLRG